MKKAIKKTCVVLLLFALLVSQVAASYSETGTLNEGTSAISAAERYLSNWAYSGQMVSIRPTYFYDVTTCTGANTSHTFSSTNSKCARCGYVRTYIIPTLLTPMAKNTQITLTARTNHTVSSISMSVKNPNGATTNLGTVTNTNSISKVYTPTVAAHPNDLYTVTVTAVSADGVTTSSTWTFRTY